MQERRTAERVRLNLRTRWEALTTQGRGAVSDLSPNGCFVLTGGEVTVGELIRLEIGFSQEIVPVWGQIVYKVSEIGFALRFNFGSEEEQHALNRLIESSN
jgi:hypothetical protein